MHKTTVLIDDEKIKRAAKLLGTRGIRDTVEAALDTVISTRARMTFLERMRSGKGFDRRRLLDARRGAWR